MLRFCLTLELREDPALIAAYEEKHLCVWPEVLAALRQAGVVDMQIYRHATRLFMLMDTTDDFSFERKAALDQSNPIVMQWEREMTEFQCADADADVSRKWIPMKRIFAMAEQPA